MTNNRIMVILRRAACLLLITMWLSLSAEAAQVDVGVEYFAGKVGINAIDSANPVAALEIKSNAIGLVGADFKAITGQTADLTDWRDASNTINTFVDKDGFLNAKNINLTGTVTLPTNSVAIASLSGLGSGVATALGTAVTGSGAIVLANSPAFISPNLGTPSAVNLSNATGLPISAISSLGTGVAALLAANLGTGVGTFLGSPTTANLAAAVTGETGTGALVFGTNPTLSAPTLSGAVGFATGSTVNFANATVSNLPTSAITSALPSAASIGSGATTLTLAGSNIPTIVAGPLAMGSSDVAATASTAITAPTTSMIQLTTASTTDITLAANPIPVSTRAGQMLIVTGKSSNTAKIKLLESATTLNLATPSVSISVDSVLVLISNGTKWIEISRSLN